MSSEVSQSGSMWLDLVGTGIREEFHDVGGVRTRVLEAGDGPALLILHGTGGHAESYQRNIGPLSQHFRVIVPDMIGHGFTDRPDVDYTLDDFANHLFGLLDVLGIDRAHLSGESLGGCVAAWMAISRPDRAHRLVLNTGILDRPDEKGLVQLADLEERTKKLAEDCSLDVVRRRLEWLVLEPDRMSEEMVRIRHRIYSQPGMVDSVVRVMHAVLSMNRGLYRGGDYLARERMADIKCPTLVLWSDHNPGKPYAVIKPAIDLIPDAEVHIIESAAHWPQFEQPETVNRLMIDFLNRPQAA
ncbi:MAG: alpha/beta hydrolase [Sphingomonas bacterium]|nr:alpha/beta hydrolase [Sphingomonas bacterium]